MQLPAPFIAQMQGQLGNEWPEFLEALTALAPTSIHINSLKHFKRKENSEGGKWWDNGVYFPARPNFTLDPAFHAGAYYVQEASSMLIAAAVRQLVDLNGRLRVLDLCAAPGGKSILLQSLITPDSLLVANEVSRSRYQVLDYNLTKWGLNNKLVISEDAEQLGRLGECFDLILVDAPCSGEGMFRKDSLAISEWSPENINRCSSRQKRILANAIRVLKPGGILLYSTCTYNDQENSENADWLLNEFPLVTAPLHFPDDWNIMPRAFGFQCYPHLVKGEGLYLCAFVKTASLPDMQRSRPGKGLAFYQRLPKAKRKELDRWVSPDQQLLFLEDQKARILGISENIYEDIFLISQNLRYARFGTPVGRHTGKELIPDPALALSTLIHPEIPSISLSKEQALRFLRRVPPTLSAPAGWQLVRFENHRLGWIKVLQNRINNYYPKEWKIRMKG